ncbi:MAG: disulfide bond formation protein B [Chlamydiota bacterium]
MNMNIFSLLGIIGISIAIGCGIYIELCCLQEPCFLCFLQRASMLMVALGLYWNLMYGIRVRHYAFSLLAALVGLSCSLRHMGLNVCKAVKVTTFFFFSYRMYTWSFLVFFSALISLSFLLFFYKPKPPASSKIQNITGGLLLVMGILCLASILYHKGVAF